MAESSAWIRLFADDQASGPIGKLIDTVESLVGKVGLATIALGAAGTAMTALWSKSVEVRAEQEKYEIILASVTARLESWTEAHARGVQTVKLMEEASRVSGASLETLANVYRNLATTLGGQPEKIAALTEKIALLAGVTGFTAEEMTNKLLRATEMGTMRMDELGRALIAMGFNAKEAQKALVDGKGFEYVDGILKVSSEQVEAFGNTWTVLRKRFSVAMDELVDASGLGNLGKGVLRQIAGEIDLVTEAINKLNTLGGRALFDWSGAKGASGSWEPTIPSTVDPKVLAAIQAQKDAWEKLATAVHASMLEATASGEIDSRIIKIKEDLKAKIIEVTAAAKVDGATQEQLDRVVKDATVAAYAEITRVRQKALDDYDRLIARAKAIDDKALDNYTKDLDKAKEHDRAHLAFLQDAEMQHADVMLSITDDSFQKHWALIERDFDKRKAVVDRTKDLSQDERDHLIANARAEADAREAQLTREANSWDGYRRTLQETIDRLRKYTNDYTSGVTMGFAQISLSVKTSTELMAGLVVGLWDSMGNAFETGFYDVLMGKFSSLKDVLTGLWSDIAKSFSKMVTGMVQDWIAGQSKMQGLPDGTYGRVNGGGLSGILGGNVGSGLYGAGVGYAGGSMIGGFSGAPGWSTGATIGGVLGGVGAGLATGAAVGSIVPIIGTIIGAIIGGLVGVLAAPNTEQHAFLPPGSTGADQSMIPVANRMGASALGIYGTSGLGGRTGWGQSVNAVLAQYRAEHGFEVHAGSAGDMQGDFDQLLKTIIPQEMLHALFGQKPSGGQDYAGISGGSSYKFSMATDEGPFVQMLKGLGFTFQKIQDVAGQIDLKAPDDFMKYLNALVGVVVGFNNLSKDLGKTPSDWFSQFGKDATAPPQFASAAQNLIDLAGELSLYSGDEQIAKAQELLQLGSQYRDSQVAYMKQLYDLQESISKSVNDQIRGMKLDLLGDPEKKNFLLNEVDSLMGDLGRATTAGQVSEIMASIQRDLGQVWGLDKTAGAESLIEKILRQAQQTATDKINQFASAATAPNAALATAMENARLLFTSLSGSTLPAHITATDGDRDALKAHEAAVGANRRALEATTGQLAGFGAALVSITSWITDGGLVGYVVATIKNDPELLKRGTGT